MTQVEFIAHLESYRTDLEGILSRFVHKQSDISIANNDQSKFYQLILEIQALFRDNLPATNYDKLIVKEYNIGVENFLESSSYDSVQKCIGILKAVKTRVANTPELFSKLNIQTTSAESGQSRLQPPEKVTLRWLYNHVPSSFWIWLVGIFFAVFVAGVGLGRLKFIQELFGANSH